MMWLNFGSSVVAGRSRSSPSAAVSNIQPPGSTPVENFDPYAPPQVEDVKPLGSLAQSARGKELNQARGILIFVGILTLAVNGFLLANLSNELREAIQAQNVGDDQVDEFSRNVRMAGYLLYGGPCLLGVVFIGLGLFVNRYPVPMTITGLVLYVGAALVFAVVNPASLASGVIVKVFIVLGLVKAIKAARAYQAETRAMLAGGAIL